MVDVGGTTVVVDEVVVGEVVGGTDVVGGTVVVVVVEGSPTRMVTVARLETSSPSVA